MFREQEIIKKIEENRKTLEALKCDLTATRAILDKFIDCLMKAGKSANESPGKANIEESKPKKEKEPTEEWRRVIIPGERFDEIYAEVSSLGRVRDSRNKRIMRRSPSRNGTPQVSVTYKNGNSESYTTMLVKNLVARAFIDGNLTLRTKAVGYIDGDINNNAANNLFIKK